MKILNWLKEHWILLLILFIGSLLRLYKLDFQSPWIDEIFSLRHTNSEKSYSEIYQFLKDNDPHPPLYYWSLKAFGDIFGHSIFTARLFSSIIGILGIVMLYKLAKEVFNTKTAIISVALLSVNFFHINYSQEIRMYSMMFLTTTASFYFLVRFIKASSIKNMLSYALFSTLMIYVQFFSLFTLFAQYIILLYFIFVPFKNSSFKFFRQTFFAGLITLLLYIPVIPIFIQTFNMKSIWIKLPQTDFMSNIINDFFGQSEFAVWIIVLGIILYIFSLSSNKNTEIKISPENKISFSFFLFSIWILVTILIPLISSYVNLPMIVNRYFINILPPIIIISAAGLNKIKNETIKIVVLLFFITFSIIQLVYINDYYNKVTKTQFREITNEIKKDSQNRPTNIVFYWSWLLPYFFNDENYHIKSYDLDQYISFVKNNSQNSYEPFWYIDGHEREFNINQESSNFLKDNFIVNKELKYFDCWAIYYVPRNYKKQNKSEELSIYSFKKGKFDADNNLAFFWNDELKTSVFLENGMYELRVLAKSLPEKPIQNLNAHMQVYVDEKRIASFYVSEKNNFTEYKFNFIVEKNKRTTFKILYDNDFSDDNYDRNLIIKTIAVKKTK